MQPTAAKLPVTVLLCLERRGRQATRQEYYQTEIQKATDATLDDFKPFVLEKSGSGFGGAWVSRTELTVERYDPQERHLVLSHSLPASKASDFTFDLIQGHGFERVFSPSLAAL